MCIFLLSDVCTTCFEDFPLFFESLLPLYLLLFAICLVLFDAFRFLQYVFPEHLHDMLLRPLFFRVLLFFVQCLPWTFFFKQRKKCGRDVDFELAINDLTRTGLQWWAAH